MTQELPKYVMYNGARHEVLARPSGAVMLRQSPRPRWGRAFAKETSAGAVLALETWDAYKARVEAEKVRSAGTCQICGRSIHRASGVIAHHGYERPLPGYQTSSCFGARKLPFEKSRNALGEFIVLVRKQLEQDRVRVARMQSPEFTEALIVQKSKRELTTVEHGTANWTKARANAVARLHAMIEAAPAEIEALEARFNGWRPTE
jgi:hypothetical protein